MEDTTHAQDTQTATQAVTPATPAAPIATQLPVAPVAPLSHPSQDTVPTSAPASTEKAPATFGEAVTYQPSGDANLDMALAFIGKHGLGPEHPAFLAATEGEFGPLKALLSEKGIQGHEAYVALAEKGYQDLLAKEAEKTQAIQQIVVQAAGDQATWDETLAWAAANADPDEREAVNAALTQGGVVAEAMATFLVNQYHNATGTTYAPAAPVVKPDASRGAANPSDGALSPVEYGKAVAELRRSKGSNFEQTPEYRQLQMRRSAWRG